MQSRAAHLQLPALCAAINCVSLRMRGIAKISDGAAAVEYVPVPLLQTLDLQEVFANATARLEVDLGCGDSSFLTALAEQSPERNFLGIERLFGRVRASCRRIYRHEVPNARVIRSDIAKAVAYLLPSGSVDVFHLMFPDPWPKRRHRPRRVFSHELLRAIERALRAEGTFRLATDQRDYFEEMMQIANAAPHFELIADVDTAPFPRSTFEQRYVERGDEIYRLVLRKTSDERCGFASQ